MGSTHELIGAVVGNLFALAIQVLRLFMALINSQDPTHLNFIAKKSIDFA
jgi:hypothetical protein